MCLVFEFQPNNPRKTKRNCIPLWYTTENIQIKMNINELFCPKNSSVLHNFKGHLLEWKDDKAVLHCNTITTLQKFTLKDYYVCPVIIQYNIFCSLFLVINMIFSFSIRI